MTQALVARDEDFRARLRELSPEIDAALNVAIDVVAKGMSRIESALDLTSARVIAEVHGLTTVIQKVELMNREYARQQLYGIGVTADLVRQANSRIQRLENLVMLLITSNPSIPPDHLAQVHAQLPSISGPQPRLLLAGSSSHETQTFAQPGTSQESLPTSRNVCASDSSSEPAPAHCSADDTKHGQREPLQILHTYPVPQMLAAPQSSNTQPHSDLASSINLASTMPSHTNHSALKPQDMAETANENMELDMEPPDYRLRRDLTLTSEVELEYSEGLGGGPAIRDLEARYKAKWRPKESERKYFCNRKKLYFIIGEVSMKARISRLDAARRLDKFIQRERMSLDKLQKKCAINPQEIIAAALS